MAARRPSPWNAKTVELLLAGAAPVAGGVLGVPAVGVYLGCVIVARAWPRPDEYDLEDPGQERARKAQAVARRLLPLGARVGFGAPGDYSGQPPAWWPPRRVTAWLALLVAVVVAVGVRWLPTPAPLGAVDAAAAFLLVQGLCSGARQAAHPADGEGFPAALADLDEARQIGLMRLAVAPAAAAIAAGGIVGVAVWEFAGDLARLPIDQWAPPEPSLATAAAIGAATAAATLVGTTTRLYVRAYNQPLRDHLAAAQAWQERWMGVPKMQVLPPPFVAEHVQPPEATEQPETHRIAYFQVAPGARIEDYRDKAQALASTISTQPGEAELVLIAPMAKTNAAGQTIPGTRQESMFSVSWNTVDLPDQPHLAPGQDNWTTAFAIRVAFDRAFQPLRLGMPDFVRIAPLHVADSPHVLYETVWRLPSDVPFARVMDARQAIGEKVGADWVRVGRRSRDANGRAVPDQHASIVFGAHPDQVTLRDESARGWLDSLELQAAFHSLKLGVPILEDSTQLSLPGHPELTEARFRLAEEVAWSEVVRKSAAIAENVDVGYLRVTRRTHNGKPSPLVSVIYGCEPADTVLVGDPPGYDPADPPVGEEGNADRLFLAGVDWDTWFRACKLVGHDGSSPSVAAKHRNDQGIDTYTMHTAPGLAVSDIAAHTDALRATSGMGYIGVEDDPADAGRFRLLAGRVDPLDRNYLAVDYADEPKPTASDLTVLHPPVSGRPDIDWVVGPGADGKLLTDRFAGSDNPHVFVGGASGSGKSVAIALLLLQVLHNNDPGDLKVALVDPKTELGYFAGAAHVNHFLGLSTPGFAANPYRALADLLQHLRDETYRRNTLFEHHPRKPQNLAQARNFARVEMAHARDGATPDYWPATLGFPWWDGGVADHPFWMPWQLLVVEECSTFFAAPANKDHRGDWEEVRAHTEELARIARSAGMHLVTATQYPKKENISTTLLAQSRRIGLPMNRVGSQLTIEEKGLERLDTPGRGKMSHGKSYRDMRVLFVRVPDENDPDGPDDRATIYGRVPKHDGGDGGGAAPMAEAATAAAASAPSVVAASPPDPAGVWAHGDDEAAGEPPAPAASAGSVSQPEPVDHHRRRPSDGCPDLDDVLDGI